MSLTYMLQLGRKLVCICNLHSFPWTAEVHGQFHAFYNEILLVICKCKTNTISSNSKDWVFLLDKWSINDSSLFFFNPNCNQKHSLQRIFN